MKHLSSTFCSPTVPCTKNSQNPGCQTSITWLYDCSGLTKSTNPTLSQCHSCNRKLILSKIVDLLTFVIPFGASYGDWLGGVTNPDLNLTIKAFTGSFLIDILYQIKYSKLAGSSDVDSFQWAILNALSTSGWVLMAQIVQDYVFHGAPNRFIGSATAGLANYFRTAGNLPSGISHQQGAGLVVFSTAMASFAGNWSMMGDNLLSRFMSCALASFLSFYSAIEKGHWEKCIIDNKLQKTAASSAVQLGVGTSLVGTLIQSAIGKPVVSGLGAGAAGLYIASNLFDGSKFSTCKEK